MKNGYYLFAYVEINEYANFYKIDTKRHDQNISLWEYSDSKLVLLRYWELERLSRIKHHNKAFSTKEQFLDFVNQLLSQFDLEYSKLVGVYAPPYFDLIEAPSNLTNCEYNYHSLCHLFSAFLMETELFSYYHRLGHLTSRKAQAKRAEPRHRLLNRGDDRFRYIMVTLKNFSF